MGLLTFSCQEDTNVTEIKETVEVIEVDNSKLINFKGLPVNHRFTTPVEDLTIESENSASTLDRYNKIRNRTTLKKGVSFKLETTELPNAEMIVLAVDQVIEQFPYRGTEEFPVLDLQDDLILSLQEQLIEKEETLSEEQKEQLLSEIILAKNKTLLL